MSQKGNPLLQVRDDSAFLDRLKAAFPGTTGKAGGVSLIVRHLLRLVMDEPLPRQYGEKRRFYDIDEMEELAREWEAGPPGPELMAEELENALELLDEAEAEGDALEVLRLRALVGRLYQFQRKKAGHQLSPGVPTVQVPPAVD